MVPQVCGPHCENKEAPEIHPFSLLFSLFLSHTHTYLCVSGWKMGEHCKILKKKKKKRLFCFSPNLKSRYKTI